MLIQTVFLTGSHGMVGKNLLELLHSQSVNIIAPSRAELDLTNFKDVLYFFNKFKPDLVIHMAGRVGGIQANINRPVDFLLDNIDIGRNVVCAARQANIKRLINLGSSCMYPCDNNHQISEEMLLSGPLEMTNEGYALSKIVVCRLCSYIMKDCSEFQYKTIIPCNIYGPYDKFSPINSHLIPAIIYKLHHSIVNNIDHVEIWGDGEARREFMYAGDLASFLLRAIYNFNSLPSIMNVGCGYDVTINQYYKVAANIMNYQGSFFHNKNKPVGMKRKLLNIDLQRSWGWMPSYSLEQGILKTYQSFLENRF